MADKIDLGRVNAYADSVERDGGRFVLLNLADARALVAAVRASKKAISDYADVLVDNEGVCTPLRATKLNRAFNALARFTDGEATDRDLDRSGRPSKAKGVRMILDEGVQRFLAEHARHENLPRTPCPECQFEANAERAPHAPGCSEGGDDAVARRREREDC